MSRARSLPRPVSAAESAVRKGTSNVAVPCPAGRESVREEGAHEPQGTLPARETAACLSRCTRPTMEPASRERQNQARRARKARRKRAGPLAARPSPVAPRHARGRGRATTRAGRLQRAQAGATGGASCKSKSASPRPARRSTVALHGQR